MFLIPNPNRTLNRLKSNHRFDVKDQNCTNCLHFKFIEEWEDGYGFSNYYCCELKGDEIPYQEAQEKLCKSYNRSPFEQV